MSLTKITCGVSTTNDLIDSVNGLIDNSSIARKVMPTQSGQLFNSSQASYSAAPTVTTVNCILIPSDFHAIQLTWFHRGGGGAVSGAKVVVATTDDIGDLLNDAASVESRKFTVPIKNGVTYNTISSNGWRNVTWNGSATLNMADSGSDNFTWIKSDLIELESLPIVGVNAGKFAGYRAVLVRMFAGTAAYCKGGQNDWVSPVFISEAGANIVLGAARFGDRVTDVTGWAVTDAVTIADDKTLPCIVEAYKSDRSAHSVMVVGDSRFASGSTEDTTREYRNMTFFLQKNATADGKKLNAIQMAHQGMPQSTYHNRAVGYLDIGSFVETAVYLTHSINDGVPTSTNIAASKAKTLIFVDKCLSKGVTPILVSPFPLAAGYTAGQRTILDDFRLFIANLGFRHFDPISAYGDANYGWLPTFGTGDSHMTDLGYQDLSENIYGLVKSSWIN